MKAQGLILNSKIKFITLMSVVVLTTFSTSLFAVTATETHHHPKKILHHKHTVKSVKKPAHKPHRKYLPVNQISHNTPSTSINSDNVNLTPASAGIFNSIEQRLIGFVHSTVSTLRYSAYKLGGTKFDPSRGVYVLDCSTYVDRILRVVYPQAYSNLVTWTGSEKPTTHDYYDFFTNLEDDKHFWNKINNVDQLRPGDILVVRYKNAYGDETGGHVMIVMDKPVIDDDELMVRVTDAASSGHSQDTRQAQDSGIGIGTLLLKINRRTYQPSALAWKIGSRFRQNVTFAMARPYTYT